MTAPRTLPTTRRRALLALASLTALSLTACSAGGDAEFEDDATANGAADGGSGSDAGGQEQAQEPSTASDGGGQEQTADASDDEAATSSVDPAEAIATLSYPLPAGDIEGTMTVGLHHLRRRDETLELLLTYTPEFSGHDTYTLWDLHAEHHDAVAPVLVDRANLTRYDILNTSMNYDSPAMWNSKHTQIELSSGNTQAYWANFAAPVDDIDTIDVLMGAGPAFEDVQIEAEEG